MFAPALSVRVDWRVPVDSKGCSLPWVALAPAQRLVIEVDGAYHAERGRADARRDAALKRAGYRVVRVEASLVMSDIERALRQIRAALLE
jgi:very-short-patch-repair endonuclease